MRKLLLMAGILMLGVMMVWAHGNGEDDPDDRDAVNTDEAIAPENPTYYEHVKPILELHCVACHSQGQIAGDIALTDPATVVKGASDIAFNASIAYMPPWMPSRQSLPMKHDRSLSDTEIATLIAWSDNFAPLGEPEDYVPPSADAYEITEIRADLLLSNDEAYNPDETVQDDYRCFAFPLDIDDTRYVTGYEFMPDVTEMAHHGIVYLVDSSAQTAIERRNFEDGQVGWSCYGGLGFRIDNEMIGAWAPGTMPMLYPEGTGFRIDPDDYLIIQMHYNLAITRQPDQTQLKLQLAPADESIAELITYQMSAPVEIPCPTGVEGPQCTRVAAVNRVDKLYGMESRYFADSLLQDCKQTLNDYADNTGEHAIGYCDYPIPAPITVFAVFGHMHELGSSFQLEVNPDSDNPITMLDIPNWDFHWQDIYQFVEPLQLERGDVVRMTCHWDNTQSDDPRYVVWGEGTADEMCFGTAIVLRR